VSVWHYLVLIALLPCIGVAVLAALLAAGRVSVAADARSIDTAMASIQAIDELRSAVEGEATNSATGITLKAIGLTREQALQLAGFMDTRTPDQARRATDGAVAGVVVANPTMAGALEPVRRQLAEARRTDSDASGATGEAARGRAWVVIQNYRKVSRLVDDVQNDTITDVVTGRRGSGSAEVLRAAEQLRVVSEASVLGAMRSSQFYLTYLAPAA
jgi:hypothetical protein